MVTKRKSFVPATELDVGTEEVRRLARKQVKLRSGRILRGQAADTMLEMRDRMVTEAGQTIKRPNWMQ